jgi:hypothetical protein
VGPHTLNRPSPLPSPSSLACYSLAPDYLPHLSAQSSPFYIPLASGTHLGPCTLLPSAYFPLDCPVRRPPLWSSGQGSWLQIQRSGLDSRPYKVFSEAVGLECGPLSPVSTTEELLGRNSSGSGLESREYGHRDLLH